MQFKFVAIVASIALGSAARSYMRIRQKGPQSVLSQLIASLP